MIGRKLSHYTITSELGRGGMGVVYLAADELLDRSVALKFLPPSLAKDSTARTRHTNEARAASSLNHPNVCTIHDIIEDDGLPVIVMEFVEGRTLADRIEDGPIPVPESIGILLQIADGLHAAHDKGILHRDIKPGNIMLTARDRVKIMDFGLARIGPGSNLTEPGTVLGTTAYMSPEQLQGLDLNRGTDLWSIGILFHEMLTGKRPFEGAYPQAVAYSILNAEPDLSDDLPDGLRDVIRRLLDKDPARRLTDASSLIDTLKPSESNTVESASDVSGEASVAVLPFVNMSDDPSQEFFCDGMAEEIINALVHVPGLRVVARTSAFVFKGQNVDVREIGRILNVKTVLEGSVRKSGNRLRINAQLVDIDSGFHVWSERFDRNLEDVFQIQDDIASAVAAQLRVRLGTVDQPLVQASTDRLDAYMLLLRGYFHMEKHTETELDRADHCFTKAFEIDNRLSRAYVGHALTNLSRSVGIDVLPPSEAYPIARDSAQRAIELDDSDGRAFAVQGLVHMWFEWDWPRAEACFQTAMSLGSGDHYVRSTYSLFLLWKGQFDDAVEVARSALPLDPLNLVTLALLGVHYLYGRRYREALQQLHAVLELEPNFYLAHMWLGDVYASQGEYDKCLASYEHLVSLGGRTPYTLNRLGMAYGLNDRGSKALDVVAELEEYSIAGYTHPIYFANVYFGLGRYDEAMDWLKKAREQKDPFYLTVRFAPWLDPMRDVIGNAGMLD